MTRMHSTGHHERGKIKPPKEFPLNVYVICANSHVAETVAYNVALGHMASLYDSEASCRAAQEAYPLPLRSRYRAYCVQVWHDGAALAVWEL